MLYFQTLMGYIKKYTGICRDMEYKAINLES
jgi:hypothetical protein